MSDRITWEGDKPGTLLGYIHGEAHRYKIKTLMFQIEHGSPSAQIGLPYRLLHRLPLQQLALNFATTRDAQKHAERYLLLAMELWGFIPKGGPDGD